MEHSKDALIKLSACEKDRDGLKMDLKEVDAKCDELKAERTELKSSLNNSQRLLNEAEEKNAVLRDSETHALRKADELQSELTSSRKLYDIKFQEHDQSTDDYNEELNEVEAERDDAIACQAELERERDFERQLAIARSEEMQIELASLQIAVQKSAMTIAALRKETIRQRKDKDQGQSTRKRYFGTHEISERFDGRFADRVQDLYDSVDGLVVSYRGHELPRGFGRPAKPKQRYELQDLGGVERVDADLVCVNLNKRSWTMMEHGAPHEGPLVDGRFKRYTRPDMAIVANDDGYLHFSRTAADFRAPAAQMSVARPGLPESDITEHGRMQRTLSSSHAQTLTPSPSDKASQSPLFEPECTEASEETVKEDDSTIRTPEPVRPQKRGIVFNPLPRPKRTRIEGPDDPRLRAPRQPRGDPRAVRGRPSAAGVDSYNSYRLRYD